MNELIATQYGNKTRIRVCGLCWQRNELLMINHRLSDTTDFWAPPGGGLEFGQSVVEALKREFLEETGLEVNVNDFRFVAEFIRLPLHAVELFFDVSIVGGTLKTGTDPEMKTQNQIILQTAYLDWGQLVTIPESEKHGILRYCRTLTDLRSMTGFYSI